MPYIKSISFVCRRLNYSLRYCVTKIYRHAHEHKVAYTTVQRAYVRVYARQMFAGGFRSDVNSLNIPDRAPVNDIFQQRRSVQQEAIRPATTMTTTPATTTISSSIIAPFFIVAVSQPAIGASISRFILLRARPRLNVSLARYPI